MSRLTDAQVARTIDFFEGRVRPDLVVTLAREVQAWRALIPTVITRLEHLERLCDEGQWTDITDGPADIAADLERVLRP
jgi:hypothetical protein